MMWFMSTQKNVLIKSAHEPVLQILLMIGSHRNYDTNTQN